MQRARFDRLVEDVRRSLPRRFKKLIENVAFQVDDWHPDSPHILGIYHGVPYQHRGPYYGNVPPDVIVIYQKAIERISADENEVRKKIREVVLHEVAHYFGFSEAHLREIESDNQDE